MRRDDGPVSLEAAIDSLDLRLANSKLAKLAAAAPPRGSAGATFGERLAHGRAGEDEVLERLRRGGVAWERVGRDDVFVPSGGEFPHDGGFDLRLRWLDERVDVKRKTDSTPSFSGVASYPYPTVLLGPASAIRRQIEEKIVDWYVWLSNDLAGGIVVPVSCADRFEVAATDPGSGRPFPLGPSYFASLSLFQSLDNWLEALKERQDELVQRGRDR